MRRPALQEVAMNVYPYEGLRQRALDPAASRLGEELLRANGHCRPGVIDLARYRVPQEPSPRLPDEYGSIDMRSFIERVRAFATQI
jgi:hypothetical protein